MKESEIKRGDIFFADLDPGVGSEQLGIRPCIIIQNDVGNHFSTTTIIAPITSRTKKTLPTHVPVSIRLGRMPKESIALLEQIRAVDKSRLLAYIGHADKRPCPALKRQPSVVSVLTEDRRKPIDLL